MKYNIKTKKRAPTIIDQITIFCSIYSYSCTLEKKATINRSSPPTTMLMILIKSHHHHILLLLLLLYSTKKRMINRASLTRVLEMPLPCLWLSCKNDRKREICPCLRNITQSLTCSVMGMDRKRMGKDTASLESTAASFLSLELCCWLSGESIETKISRKEGLWWKSHTLQGTRVCRRMGTRCRRKIVTKRAW